MLDLPLPKPWDLLLPYMVGLAALWYGYGLLRNLGERSATTRQQRAFESGYTEPVSLHPLIDPKICVGCGACVNACPEGRIIGLIGDKAHLVDPASCIGHGACKTSCPVGAIELVFGSARRGIDIPVVSPTFESTVPGLYIAGELGGMGLIANAIEQGRQAMEAIAKRDGLGQPGLYDVVIVGSGPAGIAASLAAKEKRLRVLTLEQNTLGGTVAQYPRGKVVMTRPARLPLFGKIRLHKVRKERLLDLWRQVMAKTALEVHEGVRVEKISQTAWGFDVTTTAGVTRTSTVLLATGRRGAPRKLEVPGEDLPKVTYALADAGQYRGQHVLVVGGGDSAIEAALALALQPVGSVTLAYRGPALNRAKSANMTKFEGAVRAGHIKVLLRSTVRGIGPHTVSIEQDRHVFEIRNDAVIVCIGGLLPTALLADIGVQVERKYGTA